MGCPGCKGEIDHTRGTCFDCGKKPIDYFEVKRGMKHRDRLAMAALTGLLSIKRQQIDKRAITELAYELADSMIIAAKKEKK